MNQRRHVPIPLWGWTAYWLLGTLFANSLLSALIAAVLVFLGFYIAKP